MWLPSLEPYVMNSSEDAVLSNYSWSIIAIDAPSIIRKGCFFNSNKGLFKGHHPEGYVYYCLKQANLLRTARIRPIMVFNGMTLDAKAAAEKEQKKNLKMNREQGLKLLSEGKLEEAKNYFKRSVEVTPEMEREVFLACKKKGYDCIVAPYEVHSQLAYLEKIGVADFILSEDYDLVLFGCERIFYKMDTFGHVRLYEKKKLYKSFHCPFSFENFRYMFIFSGCDYLKSLPGVTLAKAFEFSTLISKFGLSDVLTNVAKHLKMPLLEAPSVTYRKSFIEANNIYLHQLVFCPKKRALVPLNPYPEGSEATDFQYAGEYFSDEIALQIAVGIINAKTMKNFDGCKNLTNFDYGRVFWGFEKDTKISKAKLLGIQLRSPKRQEKQQIKERAQMQPNVKCDSENKSLTLEELSAMYCGPKPQKSSTDISKNQQIGNFEKGSSKDSLSPTLHHKILNPFRKIVNSSRPVQEKSTSSSVKESGIVSTPKRSIKHADKCNSYLKGKKGSEKTVVNSYLMVYERLSKKLHGKQMRTLTHLTPAAAHSALQTAPAPHTAHIRQATAPAPHTALIRQATAHAPHTALISQATAPTLHTALIRPAIFTGTSPVSGSRRTRTSLRQATAPTSNTANIRQATAPPSPAQTVLPELRIKLQPLTMQELMAAMRRCSVVLKRLSPSDLRLYSAMRRCSVVLKWLSLSDFRLNSAMPRCSVVLKRLSPTDLKSVKREVLEEQENTAKYARKAIKKGKPVISCTSSPKKTGKQRKKVFFPTASAGKLTGFQFYKEN